MKPECTFLLSQKHQRISECWVNYYTFIYSLLSAYISLLSYPVAPESGKPGMNITVISLEPRITVLQNNLAILADHCLPEQLCNEVMEGLFSCCFFSSYSSHHPLLAFPFFLLITSSFVSFSILIISHFLLCQLFHSSYSPLSFSSLSLDWIWVIIPLIYPRMWNNGCTLLSLKAL